MKSLLATMVLTLLTACTDVRTERSEILTEPAEVINSIYTPAIHDSDVGVGITTNGDLSFTPIEIRVPEQHGVVFKCQHGQFAIVGPKLKHKRLWESLPINSKVTIFYQEIYEVTYEDDQEVRRVLVDYDFLRAETK